MNSPVSPVKEKDCLLCVVTHTGSVNIARETIHDTSNISNLSAEFHQKFQAILNFVESSNFGEKGVELHTMLKKFNNEIQILCTLNDGYAQYTRRLDAIKIKILEQYLKVEDPTLIYFKIIQKSLEYLASELGFDYIGIWKDISDEQGSHAIASIHTIGNTTFVKEETLNEQIKIAKASCSGKEFVYNFPSDSRLGIVDIIYVFKNSLGQPVGYLTIDDTKQERTLTDTEKVGITTYFYHELKNMIIEHELSLSISSIKQLQKRNAELEEMSERDTMTGLLNRKALQKVFNLRLEDFNRFKIPMSVIMIDIDHFKRINDTYGHPVGDRVIRFLGSILSGSNWEVFAPRHNDYFFRMWGEEFLWVLSNATGEQAHSVCERIRQALEKHVFATPDERLFSITASFGITEIIPADVPKSYLKSESADNIVPNYAVEIITRADRALYLAKNGGRNCIKLMVGTDEMN